MEEGMLFIYVSFFIISQNHKVCHFVYLSIQMHLFNSIDLCLTLTLLLNVVEKIPKANNIQV